MNNNSLFRGNLVRLAAPTPEDGAIMANWTNNDEYLRLADDDPARPLSIESSTYGDSNNNLFDSTGFRLRTLEDDKLIGSVGLFVIKWTHRTAMLGIVIGEPAYWGKGYGSDALKLILGYSFRELNLYRIGLGVMSYNTRAIRSYEKAGFTLEGRIRGAICRDNQRFDMLHYGMLAEEWFNNQAKG